MGQIFVRASRRAKAYTRASGATRMYSSRGSAMEAAKNISKAFNAPGLKTDYYKRNLRNRLKTVLGELNRKRKAGSRKSMYR